MSEGEKLFDEFPAVPKAAWLEKVRQERKGRSLEELEWRLSESVHLAPFYHPEDGIVPAGPLPHLDAERNDWEIGEYVQVTDDPKKANQQALAALTGGAEALLFQCGDRALTPSFLDLLLKNIQISIISLHFEYSTSDACENSRPALQAVPDWRGSSYTAGNQALWAQGGSGSVESVEATGRLVVDGRPFYEGQEHTPRELARFLQAGRRAFEELPAGWSPSEASRQTKLLLNLDTSYFVSIAKIRALRILWANFTKAYGGDPLDLPALEAHFPPYGADSDPYTNMIRAATQALSAAVGGVDRLFVRPANGPDGRPDARTRRIARNVQHLLKMESHIDRVIDPAAGSYYIEKMTEVLAEEAWRLFTGE